MTAVSNQDRLPKGRGTDRLRDEYLDTLERLPHLGNSFANKCAFEDLGFASSADILPGIDEHTPLVAPLRPRVKPAPAAVQAPLDAFAAMVDAMVRIEPPRAKVEATAA